MQSTSKKIEYERLSYATLAFALIVYTINYLLNRSLFLDEASLAYNITDRDWQGLLGILDFSQSAPIAFLLSTELLVSIFGTSAYVFRFIPFLVALLACLALFRLAKEIDPHIVPIMMLWYATSGINLRYATEFKQYSGDVFFTLALMFIALRLLKQADVRLVIGWTLVSAIAVWFSHASVFVIAGLGFTLIFVFFRAKNWSYLAMMIGGCAIALLSFVIVYLNFYQYTASGTDLADTMQVYWANDFFELNLIWLVRFPFLMFQFTSGFDQPLLLILIIFGFVIGYWKMQKYYLAVLLMPILMMLIASYLQLYPLRNRFLLFLLPSIMLIATFGLLDVFKKFDFASKRIQVGIVIAFCALLFWGFRFTEASVDVRGLFHAIQEIDPTATVYTSGKIGHIADFYDFDFQTVADDAQLSDIPSTQLPTWFVFTNIELLDSQDYDALLTRRAIAAICRDGTEQVCPETIKN